MLRSRCKSLDFCAAGGCRLSGEQRDGVVGKPKTTLGADHIERRVEELGLGFVSRMGRHSGAVPTSWHCIKLEFAVAATGDALVGQARPCCERRTRFKTSSGQLARAQAKQISHDAGLCTALTAILRCLYS